ncbi:hypothetical protein VB713_20545 [Anabaena cylindrica UHCC 0172]|uniref:hypothetical protein n=1 Tax=Anabaena cylindrica TaxID=1165 RepID=UPI002B212F23|nr:hypothetical protein [Anabaena cylindrica]MEA5553332.1 hypothetical protein [Anabaena cylindrica UHCC 0172]
MMNKILTVCTECGQEHFYNDLRPNNCNACDSNLTGRDYPMELVDKFVESVENISRKLNCSFDESLDFIKQSLDTFISVSDNLVEDPVIWEILQPPD